MKKQYQAVTIGFCTAAMAMLILDAKTAMSGAQDGIRLCLYCVIPSLFPFFVLSSLISSALIGTTVSLLCPLARICGIPDGAVSLYLVGLVGGFPVGAQSVTQAYKDGTISRETAERMLGFSNNAGPAFIFGMVGAFFENKLLVLVIWIIQILSSVLTAAVLPRVPAQAYDLSARRGISLPQAMEKSLRSMASVCGWVILFRIFISFLTRWFLWFFPTEIRIFLIGMLELTNGVSLLNGISSEPVRFFLCNLLLCFGGVCVGMQTVSVTKELRTGLYFPGKLLSCLFCTVLSYIAQTVLFRQSDAIPMQYLPVPVLAFAAILCFILLRKKSAGIFRKNVL